MTEKMNASKTPQAAQDQGSHLVQPPAPPGKKRKRKAVTVPEHTQTAPRNDYARGPVKPPKSAAKDKPRKAPVTNKPADTR